MSYDHATDRIILARGGIFNFQMNPSIPYTWTAFTNIPLWPSVFMHAVIDPDSLNPQKDLIIEDVPSYVGAMEGDGLGFCRDPNTGHLYQSLWDYFILTDHGSDRYKYGYGKTMMTAGISASLNGGTKLTYLANSVIAEIATDNLSGIFGGPYNVTLHQLISQSFGGFTGNVEAGLDAHPTPNVLVFDNVVVFCFEDIFSHKSFFSIMERGTNRWLGSRMLPFSHPIQLCPTGTDRGILIAWMNRDSTSPIIAATFEWDRSSEQLVINKVETVTTEHSLTPHFDTGHATYDINRQAIVLLQGDDDTFERYVTYNLCHPGRPSNIQKVVPISAITSEQPMQGVFYTGVETIPTIIHSVYLSYASAPTSYFSSTPATVAGTDDSGIGRIVLNLTSAASDQNVTINTYLSSYSTGISSVLGNGNLYGIEPMIISASATFTVSANISATTSTTTIKAATTIIAGRPALQSDAVGAGTPQELSYPTSALNTPLVFEVNPQVWTNIFSELLTRPLYQSQRTLSRTTTINFEAHETDVQVTLRWLGGGNRVAMTWTMFSQLYNYFNNPPSAANGEYITWSPKDISNHSYEILFVNLEVGGQNSIQLNSLTKALDGFVSEEVVATFRIVRTLS